MALRPGTRLGPYVITVQIGVGGMGEVYRARDENLGRDVAIKVLPEIVAHDADRRARFEREAKTLASLDHPNIATIHGLEKSEGTHALVMELVEGPTLADRLAQGPLPVSEALLIAKQIAEALEAAHEQGIVHRDLKPANVKVRPDGTVKVLDFGLAKAMEPAAVSLSVTQSPTITTPAMTQMGVILGTAAYMSPEQARGSVVDRRADVWAFGVVLYEMLTGQRLFSGPTVGDTLAQVLEREPDLSRLPTTTPVAIKRLVRRCLVKSRKERLQHIGDARVEINEALTAPSLEAITAGTMPPKVAGWRRTLPWVAAVITTAVVAGVIGWRAQPEPPARTPARFTIGTLPPGFLLVGQYPEVAISRDGTRIVYGSGNTAPPQRLLYLRQVDQLEATSIRGTEGGSYPVFSPDGESIAFYDEANAALKRVPVLGGRAISVIRLGGRLTGVSWASDDMIIFGTDESHGLRRVAAGGGVSQALTTVGQDDTETLHNWPHALPGGREVLFTVLKRSQKSGTSIVESARIALVSIETRQVTDLLAGSHPQYSPTGHIVYSAEGTLWAVAFDRDRLALEGDPIQVVQNVQPKASDGANFSVSANGSLVYVSMPGVGLDRTLVWVDRSGREVLLPLPPAEYQYPRLSPDGTRVVVNIGASTRGDLWVYDVERGTPLRLTTSPTVVEHPFWTTDGERVVFGTSFGPEHWLFSTAADGTGGVERLSSVEGTDFADPQGWSADGKTLVFGYGPGDRSNNFGLGVLSMEGNHAWKPLVQTAASEHTASLSPGSKWIAYVSNETGRSEIYVERFPGLGARRTVSADGGDDPMWSPTGRELFYRRLSDSAMMTVPIITEPTFTAGPPKVLFKGRYFDGGGHHYDVARDGQRFLMLKEGESTGATELPIILVENWFEELKRLVPTK
jgi:Tol biopolymer transport system component/tRNA A-37 threonylcarbamoyl transferase component Bud32